MSSHIVNIICCLLFSANVSAQNKFSGKVINDADLTPIAGASVYCNHTSIATITNDKGENSITNAISRADMIASPGYERMLIKLIFNPMNIFFSGYWVYEKQPTCYPIITIPDINN